MSLNARMLLALNFGSTSLKAVSYSLPTSATSARLVAKQGRRVTFETPHESVATLEDDAHASLSEVARQLSEQDRKPDVVAHRIVHGGEHPGPAELTQETLVGLRSFSALAPLHQPPALALVQAAIQRWPDARQIGVFDTSWHQTMPDRHRVLPIPYSLYASGVKRYGFHGLAFQSAMRQLARIDTGLSNARVVLAHLGGGSSLCAVRNGQCVNTTMGMTPLGGIAMSSRSGSLDPGVLLHLQRSLAMSPVEIDRLLWRESGLKGLSGESGDMRNLLASNSEGARRAIDVYVSGVVQGIAAMAASIGGIDALVFSGGIGTHGSEIRKRVTDELAWMGLEIDAVLNQAGATNLSSSAAPARTFVVSVEEEQEMADAVAKMESERPRQ